MSSAEFVNVSAAEESSVFSDGLTTCLYKESPSFTHTVTNTQVLWGLRSSDGCVITAQCVMCNVFAMRHLGWVLSCRLYLMSALWFH